MCVSPSSSGKAVRYLLISSRLFVPNRCQASCKGSQGDGGDHQLVRPSHSAAFMRHGAGLSLLLNSVFSPRSARTLAVFPCAAPKAFKGGNTNICVTCRAAVHPSIPLFIRPSGNLGKNQLLSWRRQVVRSHVQRLVLL